MRPEPWNPDTAREALILLRQAHDAWTALLPMALAPCGDNNPVQTLRTLHQHAASTLTWARGLDDMARPSDGLPGYPDTKNAPGIELVDAAVYTCNRAIHQLIFVGKYQPPGISGDLVGPIVSDQPFMRWVSVDALPPASADSGNTPWRRRTAYLARWAGQPMTDGLAEVRAFIDAEIGPAVGL